MESVLFYVTVGVAILAVAVVLLLLGSRVITGCYA
jgi:hypothetical protein